MEKLYEETRKSERSCTVLYYNIIYYSFSIQVLQGPYRPYGEGKGK